MWRTEHTEETAASPEAVWALWSDVRTWPEWDEAVASVSLAGPFATGSPGRLKPVGGPGVTFTLTEVHEPFCFADETRLPGAVMRFEHRSERVGDRTRITHAVSIEGVTAALFARLIGRGVARGLPGAVCRLASVAAEREARAAGVE